jgi:hypothetical protein
MTRMKRMAVVFLLLGFCSVGCVIRDEVQSDLKWKQRNPHWKSPTPTDPRPQWGIISVPES